MKTKITFEIDSDELAGFTDSHIASLWHIAQANPAPITDKQAGAIAENIGREIISRWLKRTGAELWNHQGRHHAQCLLTDHGKYVDGEWQPNNYLLNKP